MRGSLAVDAAVGGIEGGIQLLSARVRSWEAFSAGLERGMKCGDHHRLKS